MFSAKLFSEIQKQYVSHQSNSDGCVKIVAISLETVMLPSEDFKLKSIDGQIKKRGCLLNILTYKYVSVCVITTKLGKSLHVPSNHQDPHQLQVHHLHKTPPPK
mgnify:CR=1 FL=1